MGSNIDASVIALTLKIKVSSGNMATSKSTALVRSSSHCCRLLSLSAQSVQPRSTVARTKKSDVPPSAATSETADEDDTEAVPRLIKVVLARSIIQRWFCSLDRVHGRLSEVTVVNQEVTHACLVQDKVTLDPALIRAYPQSSSVLADIIVFL